MGMYIKTKESEFYMLRAILSTLALIPAIYTLVLLRLISDETAALLLIGMLLFSFFAKDMSKYLVSIIGILVFIRITAGSDTAGFNLLIGQFLTLGVMFFGFLLIFKGAFGSKK